MEINFVVSTLLSRDIQGGSKPKLENLEPRTQDLARFSNFGLFQAEPRKMM